jgi:hypothetical protein
MTENSEFFNVTGRSAWTKIGKDNGSENYFFDVDKPKDGLYPLENINYSAVHYAIKAIQARTNELLDVEVQIPTNGVFGPATSTRVKMAQEHLGLELNGIFDKVTSRAFWKPLVTHYANKHGISTAAKYLWGEMLLESAADPGAVVGSDRPYDLGLMQINIQAHSSVSIEQAFDPHFSINWATYEFAKAWKKFASKPDLQIKCAILNHNSPVGANKLFETGVASERGERYINWVLTRAETY